MPKRVKFNVYGTYVRVAVVYSGGKTLDCGVLGLGIEAHRGLVLITGCAPLLQCLGRLSLPPSAGQ